MKKIATLSMCILFSFLLLPLLPAKAQEPLEFIITPNGDITPYTPLLERNGNIYTLKADLDTIWIQAKDITINGAGHTLKWLRLRGSNLNGPSDPDCMGIVVKNLKIVSTLYAVGGGNHTFIDNTFENTDIIFTGHIGIGDDVFKNNTFVNVTFYLTYGGGSLIVMSENNVINTKMIAFGTYFPRLDRNYYDDYTQKYPNATQIINSDTWDTQYVMPIDEPGETYSNTIDIHPLVNPVANYKIANFNTPPTSHLTNPAEQTNDPMPTFKPQPNNPTYFDRNIHIIILLILLTGISCTILILYKRGNTQKQLT